MGFFHTEIFRFRDVRIDTRTFEVSLNGAVVPLEPRVYDLVIHLIRCRDRVVTRDELLEHIWMQEQLSDSVIAQAVSKARKAFSDPKCIQTVYGRGYRWVPPVEVDENSSISGFEARPACFRPCAVPTGACRLPRSEESPFFSLLRVPGSEAPLHSNLGKPTPRIDSTS